jgi:hypothetical protein
MIYRALNEQEAKAFQQWVRDHYKPFDPIEGIWHPVAQLECVRVNMEHSCYKVEEDVED